MNIALIILTRALGAIQIAGWTMLGMRCVVEVKHDIEKKLKVRKARRAPKVIDSIEFQLDCMIHASELDARCITTPDGNCITKGPCMHGPGVSS